MKRSWIRTISTNCVGFVSLRFAFIWPRRNWIFGLWLVNVGLIELGGCLISGRMVMKMCFVFLGNGMPSTRFWQFIDAGIRGWNNEVGWRRWLFGWLAGHCLLLKGVHISHLMVSNHAVGGELICENLFADKIGFWFIGKDKRSGELIELSLWLTLASFSCNQILEKEWNFSGWTLSFGIVNEFYDER